MKIIFFLLIVTHLAQASLFTDIGEFFLSIDGKSYEKTKATLIGVDGKMNECKRYSEFKNAFIVDKIQENIIQKLYKNCGGVISYHKYNKDQGGELINEKKIEANIKLVPDKFGDLAVIRVGDNVKSFSGKYNNDLNLRLGFNLLVNEDRLNNLPFIQPYKLYEQSFKRKGGTLEKGIYIFKYTVSSDQEDSSKHNVMLASENSIKLKRSITDFINYKLDLSCDK